MKIVITGNIGCGKSTVTNFIHTLLPHYQVFDIDAVVRELYKDVDIKLALEREFGTSSKTEISDIVFFDEDAKNKLYDIINPYLIAAVESWQVLPDVIFDIPLFFEYFTSVEFLIPRTNSDAFLRSAYAANNSLPTISTSICSYSSLENSVLNTPQIMDARSAVVNIYFFAGLVPIAIMTCLEMRAASVNS